MLPESAFSLYYTATIYYFIQLHARMFAPVSPHSSSTTGDVLITSPNPSPIPKVICILYTIDRVFFFLILFYIQHVLYHSTQLKCSSLLLDLGIYSLVCDTVCSSHLSLYIRNTHKRDSLGNPKIYYLGATQRYRARCKCFYSALALSCISNGSTSPLCVRV